jgi:hypothetical protein
MRQTREMRECFHQVVKSDAFEGEEEVEDAERFASAEGRPAVYAKGGARGSEDF